MSDAQPISFDFVVWANKDGSTILQFNRRERRDVVELEKMVHVWVKHVLSTLMGYGKTPTSPLLMKMLGK